MTKKENKIFELKLNEEIIIQNDFFDTLVRRVVGGWIYTRYGGPQSSDSMCSVFVPLSNDKDLLV